MYSTRSARPILSEKISRKDRTTTSNNTNKELDLSTEIDPDATEDDQEVEQYVEDTFDYSAVINRGESGDLFEGDMLMEVDSILRQRRSDSEVQTRKETYPILETIQKTTPNPLASSRQRGSFGKMELTPGSITTLDSTDTEKDQSRTVQFSIDKISNKQSELFVTPSRPSLPRQSSSLKIKKAASFRNGDTSAGLVYYSTSKVITRSFLIGVDAYTEEENVPFPVLVGNKVSERGYTMRKIPISAICSFATVLFRPVSEASEVESDPKSTRRGRRSSGDQSQFDAWKSTKIGKVFRSSKNAEFEVSIIDAMDIPAAGNSVRIIPQFSEFACLKSENGQQFDANAKRLILSHSRRKGKLHFLDYIGLHDCRLLRELSLRNSLQSDIDCLQLKSTFLQLLELDLSYNKIQGALKESMLPETLQKLDLSHNNLHDVSGLCACTSLVDCNLSHNKLKHLDGLPKSIKKLDLSYNLLSTSLHLRVLSVSPDIESLWIAGNPLIIHCPQWKNAVRSFLSHLHHVDGVQIRKDHNPPHSQQANQQPLFPMTNLPKPRFAVTKQEQEQMDRARAHEMDQKRRFMRQAEITSRSKGVQKKKKVRSVGNAGQQRSATDTTSSSSHFSEAPSRQPHNHRLNENFDNSWFTDTSKTDLSIFIESDVAEVENKAEVVEVGREGPVHGSNLEEVPVKNMENVDEQVSSFRNSCGTAEISPTKTAERSHSFVASASIPVTSVSPQTENYAVDINNYPKVSLTATGPKDVKKISASDRLKLRLAKKGTDSQEAVGASFQSSTNTDKSTATINSNQACSVAAVEATPKIKSLGKPIKSASALDFSQDSSMSLVDRLNQKLSMNMSTTSMDQWKIIPTLEVPSPAEANYGSHSFDLSDNFSPAAISTTDAAGGLVASASNTPFQRVPSVSASLSRNRPSDGTGSPGVRSLRGRAKSSNKMSMADTTNI